MEEHNFLSKAPALTTYIFKIKFLSMTLNALSSITTPLNIFFPALFLLDSTRLLINYWVVDWIIIVFLFSLMDKNMIVIIVISEITPRFHQQSVKSFLIAYIRDKKFNSSGFWELLSKKWRTFYSEMDLDVKLRMKK